MKKYFLILIVLFLSAGPVIFADDTPSGELKKSGDEFFDDAEVEVKDQGKEQAKVDEVLDKESVSFTGNLDATGSYNMTRNFLWGLSDIDDNSMNYYLMGDFLLDIRLRRNFKAFVDLNIGYSNIGLPVLHQYNLISTDGALPPPPYLYLFSENQDMAIGIKEIFVDFNIDNAVFFRVGKQVLQWGRGYLWNPTDLVNIEKKSFLDVSALRDGVFGLRFDVTFHRNFHFFSFIQFQGAEDLSDIAVAGKFELLVGSTEMSLSAWARGGKLPVFGYDISIPLFWDLDFRGEVAVSWGDNLDKMDATGSTYSIRDRLVPRVAVGLSRSFDVGDVEDRLTINGEFYYNDSGYDVNMFEVLNPLKLAVFYTGYFDAGNYGKFYGALFVSIAKFLVSNLTLNLSGIGNFSDMSFIAVADFSYQPVYNFTMSFKLISYLGANLREYTIAVDPSNLAGTPGNNMFSASLSCSVKF